MMKLEPGEVLRNERKLQGMTQEQLASILNIDKRSVSKVETGEYKPTLETIKKYSEPLGKEPVVILVDKIDDKNYPVGRSYTYFMIENIRPIKNIETTDLSVRNISVDNEDFEKSLSNLLTRPRKARDISALIEFWELILASGALDVPCDGIQLSIKAKEKTKEQATIDSFLDSVLFGLITEEKNSDEIFGAKLRFSHKSLVEKCWTDRNSGYTTIVFNDTIQQDKRIKSIVETLVNREKEILRKAESYLARNPDGFHFMCYDLPFEYDDLNDSIDSFEIVKAWTLEEAKKKYLEFDQKNRLYEFYQNDFVRVFVEMTLNGDTFENLVNSERIDEIANSLYESVERRTEGSSFEGDDFYKIKDEIIRNYSKEELFNAFGTDDFKTYWLERAIPDVGAQIPKSEADMMEYVYSVLTCRNRDS